MLHKNRSVESVIIFKHVIDFISWIINFECELYLGMKYFSLAVILLLINLKPKRHENLHLRLELCEG